MRFHGSILGSCVFSAVITAALAAQPALTAPSGPSEFQSTAQLPAGAGAHALTTGNFNRDGKPDVAVANITAGVVSVFLGSGAGRFQAPLTTPSVSSPASVAAGDFNGDGKQDLVTVQQNGARVSVLLGNGDGTFQTPTVVNTGSTGCSMAWVGDVNGDSRRDIVAACASGISVLRGKGDGTFRAPHLAPAGGAALSVADVNADGKPDLLVPNKPGAVVQVLLGNGDGTFQNPVSTPTVPCPVAVVVGDFSGDGKLDLATANTCGSFATANTVSLLAGNGDGTFQAPRNFNAGADAATSIAAADFNGDGKPDVALTGFFNNSVAVLLNDGTGGLQSPLAYGTASGPEGVVPGDFNNDGKRDLVVVNASGSTAGQGSLSVLLGNGDGSFQAARAYRAGAVNAAPRTPAVVAADLNADGKPDIAAVSAADNSVAILLGNGDGTLQPLVPYDAGSSPAGIAIADLNKDGKPDIAVANQCTAGSCTPSDGTVGILLGNGDGTFQTATTLPLAGNPSAVAIADFNEDGTPDLAVQSPLGTLSIFLGDGVGNFSAPLATSIPSGGAGFLLAVDLNKDGKTDIAAVTSGQVIILLGSGDGTFQTPQSFAAAGAAAIAAADFNADGKIDLAVTQDGPTGGVFYFSGNGDGTFQPPVFYATATGNTGIVAADVDGDGKPDLVLSSQPASAATVLVGNGNGTFQAPAAFPLAGPSIALAVADLNKDGAPDIVAAFGSGTNSANGVQVLLNNGGTALVITTSVNPAVYGEPVVLTASVTASVHVFGRPAPTGSVTFLDGTSPIKTVPLSSGIATLNASALGVRNHSLSFAYSGDARYNPGKSAPVIENITISSATTSLAPSLATPIYGQPVSLTATVSPEFTGIPSGSVAFLDGIVTLGTVPLSGGAATLIVSSFAAGPHSLTASYQGSTNFAASTSVAVPLTVARAAVTITLTASPNPAIPGEAVSLVAAVAPQFAGTPTGRVFFVDGTTSLGSAPLNGGAAQIVISYFATGTHTITCLYAGDSNYTGGSGGPLTLTVLP